MQTLSGEKGFRQGVFGRFLKVTLEVRAPEAAPNLPLNRGPLLGTPKACLNDLSALWEASGLDPLLFPTWTLLASAMVDMFNKAELKDHMGPFAGQVSGLITEIKPAAQIVEDMVEEAVDILTRRLSENVNAR